jgi:predicted RNA-binding Zn ribbon-like protein
LRVNYGLVETRLISQTDLAGGHPALDLVNTVGGLLGQPVLPEDELMHEYDDVVDYGLQAGTVSERQARRLRRRAKERPREAAAALALAFDTRALVDSAFRPLAEGGASPPDALEELARRGADALTRARLVPDGEAGGYRWSWEHADELEAPLWPAAHTALELLTDGPLDRLKLCGRCRWLFLDTTKNRSRRWCSMEECGTHTKIERYVERRRERRAKRS